MTNHASRSVWHRDELTYCSNVHPANTYPDLEAVVTRFIGEVRKKRNAGSMGSGLWINQSVADDLVQQPEKLQQFVHLLARSHIDLFTLNGFPYGNFHGQSVKERVYTPDWSDPQRSRYTRLLAEILAACLPDRVSEGTISTLPLGFRHTWSEAKHQASLEAFCQVARFLGDLKQRQGRSIRVCLEMEPDCVLETTDELIRFFRRDLPEKALALRIPEQLLRDHLGVCFDVCHQAVMFEDCAESLSRIAKEGISVGKIQVSSALVIVDPEQTNIDETLAEFTEPRYLHQVRTLAGQRLVSSLDLPFALDDKSFPTAYPWRIHFHVPIHATLLAQDVLSTTQQAILDVLDFLKANPNHKPHLEVETYTWQVLPAFLRPKTDASLIAGLTDELNWLEMEMLKRSLIQ
ncbi:MAG: metabolite traffic protein EboE [Gammaproteobacteria bacterium]